MRKRLLALALFGLAGAAGAADGTTDLFINPATGATISAPGSYRLVSDVTMAAGVTGIVISAGDVTLDLGGHTITSGLNGPIGINNTGPGRVTVMNGTILGFSGRAVFAGNRSKVLNVRAEGNNLGGGGSTIQVSASCVVEGCIVANNTPPGGATVGIQASTNCRIIGNTVENNDSPNNLATGINAGTGSLIEGNLVRGNTSVSASESDAVIAATRCVVRNNVVTDNDNTGAGTAVGISASTGGLVEGNLCSDHTTGAAAVGNSVGIGANGCLIIDNECFGNNSGGANGGAFGIAGGTASVVRNNRCHSHVATGTGFAAGIVMNGTGSRIEGNHCVANVNATGFGWGIRVTGGSNFVADNSVQGSTTAGLVFTVATNNRSERNRLRQTTPIDLVNGVAPASAGAGDLADVVF